MVGSVMNPVTVKDDASAPYQLKGTAVTDPVEAGEAGSIAVTANEVTAALRGQTEFVTTVDFYKKKTPIGCIGRDVRFSDITVTIESTKNMVYTFCDPSGYQGTSDPAESLEENKKLYETANSGVLKPDGVAGSSYFQRVFGDGTGGNGVPNEATDITVEQAKQMSRVWDPVMAAQLTQGGMCCDALYYGNEGVVVLRLREWARSPTMNRPWQVGTWLLSLPLVQCALCMAVATATQPALLETSTRSTLRRRCFSKARPSTYLLHHPSTACPSLLPLLRRKRQTKLSRSSARRTSHP